MIATKEHLVRQIEESAISDLVRYELGMYLIHNRVSKAQIPGLVEDLKEMLIERLEDWAGDPDTIDDIWVEKLRAIVLHEQNHARLTDQNRS